MSTKNFHWLIGLILVLIVLVGLAVPAAAQDGPGTPTPDDSISHVTGYHLEMLFPVVVRFFLDLNVPPTQITDITFTIEAAGGVDRSITLSTADNVLIQTDSATRLIYNWSLQEDPQPAPFGTVHYKWVVRTSDGVESEAINEFELVDSNHGDWRDGGEPPLKLYWQGQYLDANPAWYEVMPVYNLLSDHTGLSPQLAYAVYDPGVELCREVTDAATGRRATLLISTENGDRFPCSVSDFRNIYAAADITLLQRPTIGFTEFKDLLTDRMVRAFYGSLWVGKSAPAWFETGMARLYRTHAGYNELQIARAAGRTDALLTFADLATPLPSNSPGRDQALWDAESYLLVLYLTDRVGKDAPFQLAADIAENEDGFEGAWQVLVGTDINTLWNEWEHWLFSDAADQAVLWTPYLPAE